MGKSKRELSEEQKRKYDADALKRKQAKIKKEFEYLLDSDTLHFRADFIRAQANEICNYYKRIKLTPFKALEGSLRDMIFNEDFLYNFYLMKNDYGELVPDTERIDKLILENVNPEDLVKNMF
jgi:hypothetical protein